MLKRNLLQLARHTGLPVLSRALTSGHLRILGYHGLWVTPGYQFGNCSFMAPETFERRMALLRRSGLDVLSLDDAVTRLSAGTLSRPSVVITIDDGWVSTLTHMLPILEKYELPATLYATTWYSGSGLPVSNMAIRYFQEASGRSDLPAAQLVTEVDALPPAERTAWLRALGRSLGVDEHWLETRQFEIMRPDELRAAHGRGLDVQLHTHRHIEVDDHVDRLAAEIAENRAFLADAIGPKHLAHFCYPCGAFHPAAPQILDACGIRSATLVEHGLNPPGSDLLMLRRLLDSRSIADAEFEAYLSGMLHLLHAARSAAARATGRRQGPVSDARSSGERSHDGQMHASPRSLS
ncbi:polysaccharide deacetylase [Sphingomonas deserti]|uniref:Chitooligosaccharide deacetylase n=1 Tax=Allosphingosinicella deserti TaxID=2116704 RepID=A0A2P7QJ11_9SPHN|nr:polysaccharide deacetylase [Sphingomonas deserti]